MPAVDLTNLVRPGDTLDLRDEDYRYGAGELQLRVTRPAEPSIFPGWVTVYGREVHWSGRLLEERPVSVDLAALRRPNVRVPQQRSA